MPRRLVCPLSLGIALLVTSPPAAHAQGSGNGFLFRTPRGSVAIRGGYDHAIAGDTGDGRNGDVFTFATDQLTLSRRDFSSASFVFDVAYKISPRFDAVFSLAASRSSTPSEFRDWLDNNNLPIRQTTDFQRVPLTAAVKSYFAAPGRSIGHFAWIPSRYAPYVGGGGGVMWYRFRQTGDFIDFNTLKVFPDVFDSDGWTPTAHVFGGVEVSLTPRLAVTTEGRFLWARAPLSSDFAGFDRIDLSGLTITSGVLIRY